MARKGNDGCKVITKHFGRKPERHRELDVDGRMAVCRVGLSDAEQQG
jgi:hypothetical protein